MDDTIKNLGETIATLVKGQLGDLKALGADAEPLIERVSVRAAALTVQSMIAVGDTEAQLALQADKRQIEAQLANLEAALAAKVTTAFWDVVQKVARAGVSIALSAV